MSPRQRQRKWEERGKKEGERGERWKEGWGRGGDRRAKDGQTETGRQKEASPQTKM